MTSTHPSDAAERLRRAFTNPQPSVRLRAALAAGSHPDPSHVSMLIERCATESDFYVRDMLTWALTRHPSQLTVPLLLEELGSVRTQACSQALHTLSKIGDTTTWSAITRHLLQHPDDEVARSAWRAGVVLVPPGSAGELARVLATQLGRGDRDLRLSLSRALVGLGEAARDVVTMVADRGDDTSAEHAIATLRLLDDPDESFDAATFDARRIIALGPDADR
ncbi:HEAT repeat domain-containing protein [Williamsia sp.]|uniref:HEAT repeat domain-containing protein n=1 Tax=Williamsia sp. TaxID=1872085 RepID=UPI0025F9CD71|nr:HEAT repeat domain-containing protein [Williamsia sp.]